MDVLNYTYHTTVESVRQCMNYVAAFAVAQGWTLVEWQEDVTWSAGTGWVAGDETYCEISSTGYGSQPLRYRLHAVPDLSNTNVWLYVSGAKPTDPEYDISDSYTPAMQSDHSWWCPYATENYTWERYACRLSMPPTRFPALWVWGDEKTIIVIMQLSAVLYDSFAIGSPRLLPEFQNTTELQGIWIGKDSYSDVLQDAYWWNFENKFDRWFWCFGICPHSGETNYYSNDFKIMWWEGARRGYSPARDEVDAAASLHILRTGGTWGSFTYGQYGYWPRPANVVSYNDWTEKWVGISPVFFVRNFSGSYPAPPVYPVGTLPFAYIKWTGLAPGETIKYGTDQYMTFPMNCFLDDYGVALRYA